MASHRQFAKDQASSESQTIESRLKTSTARLEAGNLVHDDGIGPLWVNRNSYVTTEMWSFVGTQPWTEWSHVFFVSFMSPPDRRISRKSSSNLKLVIWRWIARGTANEPCMIRNVLCVFWCLSFIMVSIVSILTSLFHKKLSLNQRHQDLPCL